MPYATCPRRSSPIARGSPKLQLSLPDCLDLDTIMMPRTRCGNRVIRPCARHRAGYRSVVRIESIKCEFYRTLRSDRSLQIGPLAGGPGQEGTRNRALLCGHRHRPACLLACADAVYAHATLVGSVVAVRISTGKR